MAEVRLMRRVLASSDALANEQLAMLDRHRVLGVNIMSSPGAGKTCLVERTIEGLAGRCRMHIVEGDIQGDLDARRIAAMGVGCTQINTQGACHLDGMMLAPVFSELPLDEIDLLIIENVGNLVCPAEFRLPVHYNVTILSTPEGSDKPVKYPLMFTKSDVLIVNKIDLLRYVNFSHVQLVSAVRRLRPGLPIIKLSCRTGQGVRQWLRWLQDKVADFKRRP